MSSAIFNNSKGLTLIELIVTLTILGILASGVFPIVSMTSKRAKEVELRRNLRTIRTAIDEYKKKFDKMPAGPLKTGSGYPKDLDELLEGKDFGDASKTGKIKFLRRKIYDPFNPPESDTDKTWGWGARSSVDKYDSTQWGEEDLFDLYSKSDTLSLDGKSKYSEW